MGGTEHLCDQRNGHSYKPDGKSIPCQLHMGTQAGFAFALNSSGWIFFVYLPTLGFLKCGGQQSWGSTGCLVSQSSSAPLPGQRHWEQLANTRRADQGSEWCCCFSLDWRKTNRLPPEFWLCLETELRVP